MATAPCRLRRPLSRHEVAIDGFPQINADLRGWHSGDQQPGQAVQGPVDGVGLAIGPALLAHRELVRRSFGAATAALA